ncbi:hypothetical protein [Janthinobacterium sp. PC23-8]|uniref:hypothetical protein n=1 Tax=Janthinobacterium sp. PC23-8 TaxID=2012679 RepID=UPI000B95F224|nr:hypothetical protein [Janthinobacterium sp. PC23-8]OYO27475.1 hypothetical protein CD932_20065 [Janthinobacterium sp. PC23-8]
MATAPAASWTSLRRVSISSQADADSRIWRLDASSQRVPDNPGASDGATPGSQSLRALWLRNAMQPVADGGHSRSFADPLLIELFVRSSQDGADFALDVCGHHVTISLQDEQRVWLAPLAEQPDRPAEEALRDEINVPAYRLAEGCLTIEEPANLVALLPGMVPGSSVELDRHGLVCTMAITPPDNSDDIDTRVRLTAQDRLLSLTLLPERQDAIATARWQAVWRSLQRHADDTRHNAWARLLFEVGTVLPALAWPVENANGKLAPDWTSMILPRGLLTATMADQPTESQMLGPEQVLRLTPSDSRIVRHGTTLTITAWDGEPAGDIHYRYLGGEPARESISFPGALHLSHAPAQVASQLAALTTPEAGAPPIGFMKTAQGWLELPFSASAATPPSMARSVRARHASGSVLIGTRRQQLHASVAVPNEAPWSVRLDAPERYWLSWTIAATATPSLAAVEIKLDAMAIELRGLAWLSNRAPDQHDALPRFDDRPDGMFDLVLRNVDVADAATAPFMCDGLALHAPAFGAGWDAAAPGESQRASRRPSLADGILLTIRPALLAPDAGPATQRIWCRHTSMPAITAMPGTRADLRSPRPHASRGLTPFDGATTELQLSGVATFAPTLLHQATGQFTVAPAGTDPAARDLVVLSLPGITLRPLRPDLYLAGGSYSLPIGDEALALAEVPGPVSGRAPPQTDAAGPGYPTAVTRRALATMVAQHHDARLAVQAQQSIMFAPAAPQTDVPVVTSHLLAPRHWGASAHVDLAVSIKPFSLGSVQLSQTTPAWRWDACGNALLSGPSGHLVIDDDTTVAIASGAGVPALAGWSIAERDTDGTVIDGRGVGWGTLPAQGPALRPMRIEGGTANDPVCLFSTATPLPIAPLHDTDVTWTLALTDLPLRQADGQRVWRADEPHEPRLAPLARSWSWVLAASGAASTEAWPVSALLWFSPAALTSVEYDDIADRVSRVVLEGTLTLGQAGYNDDARNRVELTLLADGAGLALHAVTVPGGRCAWKLAPVEDGIGVLDGVPWLSAALAYDAPTGRLSPTAIALDARCFGAPLTVALDLAPGETLATLSGPPPDAPAMCMALQALTVDLRARRVVAINVAATLRDAVALTLDETWQGKDAEHRVRTLLNWFGNALPAGTTLPDTSRRGLSIAWDGEAPTSAVTVFAHADATFTGGALTLALGEDWRIGACYLELMFDIGALCVSHQLTTDATGAYDALRFDGDLALACLIPWPDLTLPALAPESDGTDVRFDVDYRVCHDVIFALSDHRIAGVQLAARSPAGVIPAVDQALPAVSWLVEATHTLTWPDGAVRKIHCLQALQLWAAPTLAQAVNDKAQQYSFTPSYLGNKSNAHAAFPYAGVRKVGAAFAGVFVPHVFEALATANGGDWIVLGGMSVLYRIDEAPDAGHGAGYLSLHLPFIGALGDGGAAPTLTAALTVVHPPPFRMSRHDLLPTPVRLDADTALAAGGLMSLPVALTVRHACDALPAHALSGQALMAGWNGDGGELGWHVEQLQRPGDSVFPEPWPHPFPRASVMLALLHQRLGKPTTDGVAARAVADLAISAATERPVEVHSVLVRLTGSAPFNIDVRTVVTAAPHVVDPAAANADAALRSIDLDMIIAGAHHLRAMALTPTFAAGSDRERWAWALTQVNAPAALIRRRLHGGRVKFALVVPPAPGHEPLTRHTRPLRPIKLARTDGRRTWPEPAALTGLKRAMAIDMEARQPFQAGADGLAAIVGRIRPPRLAGARAAISAPAVGAASTARPTVWLDEWERSVFEISDEADEDTAPREVDAATSVLPVAPGEAGVRAALLRMEPALPPESYWQSCLPPLLDCIDVGERAGTLAERGGRVLLSLADDWAASALAGPAETRSMRLPRPAALPPNAGGPEQWRRTVGFYGKPETSCTVIDGAWELIFDDPQADGLSAWYVFLGNPLPDGMATPAAGQRPLWSGATTLTCFVFNRAGIAHAAPADFVFQTFTSKARARIRHAGGSVELVSFAVAPTAAQEAHAIPAPGNRLLLLPAPGTPYLADPHACVLEVSYCSQGWTAPDPGKPTLESAGLRRAALAFPPFAGEGYPMPVRRITVLFADPAYDAALSSARGISVVSCADDQRAEITLWADRAGATPSESLVIRATVSMPSATASTAPPGLTLSARVRRHGVDASVEEALLFVVGEPASERHASIGMNAATSYALPLPSLLGASSGRTGLAPGDTLLLELLANVAMPPARLAIPIDKVSSLPMPDALYSLIDIAPGRSACVLHASLPQPERMYTCMLDAPPAAASEPPTSRLCKRALFVWSVYEASDAGDDALGYSVIKTDLSTQSTWIPECLEDNRLTDQSFHFG